MLGSLVLWDLPVSLLPDVPIPQITVQVNYPNTNARELENNVIKPLRNQLMQVNHLKDIKSEARLGTGHLALTFQYGVNTNLAFIEVNEKLDQVISFLPRDMERPRVVKANVADIPVFHLSMIPKTDLPAAEMLQLSEFARTVIKRRIEQLESVAFVDISGMANPMVQITPKASVMRSAGLTENDIQQALLVNQIDVGGILVQDGHYQFDLRLRNEMDQIRDIGDIYLPRKKDQLQLKDIADIQLVPQQRTGKYLFDLSEGIILTVRKQANAQLFDLEASFQELLTAFEADYPNLTFQVTNDQTQFLRVSIDSLRTSLAYGALFAFVVMFLFFIDWRAPVLIIISIPTALLVTLLGFELVDLSINTISLAGLILGVGLMIDNAIIVIDNIRQQRQFGASLTEACIRGGNEVIRPLISSALTTCSVFLPLIFLSGISGALFYDQAVAISLGLGASLIVSFILLPTLARLILKKQSATGLSMNEWMQQVERGRYARSVDFFLHRPWLAVLLLGGLAGLGYWGINALPQQAFPEVSRTGIEIRVDWNEPIALSENESRIARLYAHLGEKVATKTTWVGSQQFLLEQVQNQMNESLAMLYLPEEGAVDQLIESVQQFFQAAYPMAKVDVVPIKNLFDEIFSQNTWPLALHLQQSDQGKIPDQAAVAPLLSDISLPVAMPTSEVALNVTIRQDRADLYQVTYDNILNKVKSLFNANEIASFKSDLGDIPIVVGSMESTFWELVTNAFVRNKTGTELPLKDFLQVQRIEQPKAIQASRSGESLTIGFPTATLDDLPEIKEVVGNYPQFYATYSGQLFEDQVLIWELVQVALIAALLLYFILAAQFESFVQPFIVMLMVPIGVVGALVALYWSGSSLNLLSLIGMVVMGGIIVNDAILKVDMMNRLNKDFSLREAIHGAGVRRLRPIIMTSLTTMLALLPILFSEGLGAALQRPLALAVIGGLSVGTLASLYIVPVLYQWMIKDKQM